MGRQAVRPQTLKSDKFLPPSPRDNSVPGEGGLEGTWGLPGVGRRGPRTQVSTHVCPVAGRPAGIWSRLVPTKGDTRSLLFLHRAEPLLRGRSVQERPHDPEALGQGLRVSGRHCAHD